MSVPVPIAHTSGVAPIASWRPSAGLDPAERYGRFEILGRIGRGGMAEILLARERSLAGGTRHLVIKRVLPEVRECDAMLHMFLDEARVVMGLSHPNLCQIYEVGEQDGAWFIAMEWVNGITLHELVKRAFASPPLDYGVIARILAQCAEALHHAHTARDAEGNSMQLVHRDVSPHNIMVAYDGRVKLLDFGIAKTSGTTHRTEAGVVKGKICYMAPEQWLAEPVDARTDVFALGACLYEALTGRVLFRRDVQADVMKAVLAGEVPSLAEVAPEAPEALRAIAHRALARRPEDRFQTARELGDALERFIATCAEPVGAARVADYTRQLFRAEVRLGPVLERAMRGADLGALRGLLLPPLPAALRLGLEPPAVHGQELFVPPSGASPTRITRAEPRAEPPAFPDLPESASDDGDLPNEATVKVVMPPAPDLGQIFADAPTRPTQESLARLERAEEEREGRAPRQLVRTLSLRAGARLRRAALAALLAGAVPLSFAAHAALTRVPTPVVKQLIADEEPLASIAPAFSVLGAAAAVREAPVRQAPSAAPARRQTGFLSINTRPWSTVYLGKRLLGSTPLSAVPVPRGTLRLKLVDRDGHVHRRTIAGSPRRERTVFLKF